jgi:hypothetical protein
VGPCLQKWLRIADRSFFGFIMMKKVEHPTKNPLDESISAIEFSHPLDRRTPDVLNAKNELNSNITDIVKTIIVNSLIFIGVYFSYSASLVIFQTLVTGLASIANPASVFFILVIGVFLTVLGVGRFTKKSDWVLYLSPPLMSFILGFFYNRSCRLEGAVVWLDFAGPIPGCFSRFLLS